MARTLSAVEKGELKALLAKKKLTKVEKERLEFLTAGRPCVNCEKETEQKEVKIA